LLEKVKGDNSRVEELFGFGVILSCDWNGENTYLLTRIVRLSDSSKCLNLFANGT